MCSPQARAVSMISATRWAGRDGIATTQASAFLARATSASAEMGPNTGSPTARPRPSASSRKPIGTSP